MAILQLLARSSQAYPRIAAENLPVHRILDAALAGRLRMIAEHDLCKTIAAGHRAKQSIALFADVTAALDADNFRVLDRPHHWLTKLTRHALYAVELHRAVGRAGTIVDTAPTPGEMTASCRFARFGLHGVNSFVVVLRHELCSIGTTDGYRRTSGDDLLDFPGDRPQQFVRKARIVRGEQTRPTFEIYFVRFHSVLGRAFVTFLRRAQALAIISRTIQEHRPHPDDDVDRFHGT